MTRVGVTGSRFGSNAFQRQALRDVLSRVRHLELHHGDAIGADALAHHIAMSLGAVRIVVHPPENPTYRAFVAPDSSAETSVQVLEPKPYLVRDKDMVDAVEWLIAVPSTAEKLRSGTWATVRYARKVGLPIWMITPDRAQWEPHRDR